MRTRDCFFDALGKRFFLALGLLLRRRLVSGHVIVDGALLSLAEVEDGSSILAVDEKQRAFVFGALLFCFGFPVLPLMEQVFCMAVRLP